MNKPALLRSALAGLTITLAAVPARAATILATDLTGVVTSGAGPDPTATSVTWNTASGINTPASSLTFTGADGFFTATNHISVDRNLSNEGPWSTTINLALDAGTAAIDLTNLSFNWKATTNSGANQSQNRNTLWTVEITGSTSGSLGTNSIVSGSPGSFVPATLDLSSFSLANTETYTLTLTAANSGSPGHNAAIDDLEITGDITPVPEPAAAVLFALGGVAFMRRRR